jgi:hypothetical protein
MAYYQLPMRREVFSWKKGKPVKQGCFVKPD